ncbi:tetratricopeptide repeat protein [Verrucomicrobiota bacterium sgz303538]
MFAKKVNALRRPLALPAADNFWLPLASGALALQLWLVCGVATVSAADRPSAIEEARKALRENVPQAAVQKLQAVLKMPELAGPDRSLATRLLAEALLVSGQADEALSQLEKIEDENDDTSLLRARAFAAVGRWADALPIFHSFAAQSGASLSVILGEAESLAALDRKTEAAAVLQRAIDNGVDATSLCLRLAELYAESRKVDLAGKLLEKTTCRTPLESNWKEYIKGCIFLATKQEYTAMEIFQELVPAPDGKQLREPEHLSESLLFGVTLGLTEARIAVSGYASARGVLENFIKRYPESAYLEAAFRRLNQIYSQEDDPAELRQYMRRCLLWAQNSPARRAALATFYVARLNLREREYEKAATLLQHFVQTYPTHPRLCDALLMQADMHLAQSHLTDAVHALEAAMRQASSADQRGEIELRTAIVHHQQGEYLLAANLFRSAAERAQRLRTVATYDAALAWLNQRNDERFTDELQKLNAQPQTAALQGELLLEQGLVQARNNELRAEETLQLFLHQNQGHPRAAEARVALAELAFLAVQSSANPQQQAKAANQASEYLQVANSEPRSPEMTIQADYLAVFLADAQTPRNDARVIELAKEFLRHYKQSPLVNDVRMKLGQVYFRDEDFANAETEFATLADEAPESPYAETALFLAGQSAMKLAMNPGAVDRGLGFFDRVVKRDNSLKLYARQEQAIAQSYLGHEEEALILYELILASQPAAGPELRFAALCGKGNSLVKLGRKDPFKLEAAVAVYDQLANAPNVTASWRNQALYKKGKALEQLKRMPEALTAFYDVLERSNSADREHFWSGKAGFDAGRLLEQQEQWKSAIGVYEKLAKLEGPRAAEARDRVRQLRLEHFVWE